jgi:hypothetical protein
MTNPTRKNRKPTKKHMRFLADPEWIAEVKEFCQRRGYSFTEIAASAIDYFLHLEDEDQVRVLAYRRIFEALRIDPNAYGKYPAESRRVLDYVEQRVKTARMPRQRQARKRTCDP